MSILTHVGYIVFRIHQLKWVNKGIIVFADKHSTSNTGEHFFLIVDLISKTYTDYQ